ncbi:hypothetical protein PIB30_089714, partial [Stylosanthes scabra]|nr:hypothetical protein [Stylosanthes scabra]
VGRRNDSEAKRTGLRGRTAVVQAFEVLSSEYSDDGYRHGYVSAAAPGIPDGEGGVKAPFSTAVGDGEDNDGASEVRMGARRRMATAGKWRGKNPPVLAIPNIETVRLVKRNYRRNYWGKIPPVNFPPIFSIPRHSLPWDFPGDI